MAGFSTGTADNAGEWGGAIWHGSLVSGVRIAIGEDAHCWAGGYFR